MRFLIELILGTFEWKLETTRGQWCAHCATYNTDAFSISSTMNQYSLISLI